MKTSGRSRSIEGRASPLAALLLLAALTTAACGGTPAAPTESAVAPIAVEEVVGQMAVSFLNRFAASGVAPAACLVDFSDACRGKRDELADIQYNRAHYRILGARLGAATVRLGGSGANADMFVPCAFDSRVTKCEGAGCVLGSFEHVAGTCNLTGVREAGGWRLCTSTFSASAALNPSSQLFFGLHQD